MMHLALPLALAAALIGTGVYGILARRHPVMLLISMQIVLAGAAVILVAVGGSGADRTFGGHVLAIILAILGTAIAVVTAGAALLALRVRGRVELTDDGPDGTPLARPVDDDAAPENLPEGRTS